MSAGRELKNEVCSSCYMPEESCVSLSGCHRSGSNPRETLTELDRKQLFQYAEENRRAEQIEICGIESNANFPYRIQLTLDQLASASKRGATIRYPCKCENTANVRPSTISKVLSYEESYLSQGDGSRPPARQPIGQESWQSVPRGRTPERVPHSSSFSRNSSASSARSMIDERMEWANEERSRSASRPPPEPASPFTDASFYRSSPSWSDFIASFGPSSLLSSTETFAPSYISALGNSNAAAEEGGDLREEPRRAAKPRYPTCISYSRASC